VIGRKTVAGLFLFGQKQENTAIMAALTPHVAERNIQSGVVGGFRFGIANSLFANGDLTSLAAAKAAVAVVVAKLHTAEKLFGPRATSALDQAENFYAGATTGSDSTNITGLSAARGRFLRF
jgi:hypothetical protein